MDKGTHMIKPLTLQQLCFANNLMRGKSQIQAYREAYPADKSCNSNLHCSAYRLSRHPQIQALIKNTYCALEEELMEDVKATKRYILKQLFTLSKRGKQDATKIKALELLGKVYGLFGTPQVGGGYPP